jgi:hypothetical protein
MLSKALFVHLASESGGNVIKHFFFLLPSQWQQNKLKWLSLAGSAWLFLYFGVRPVACAINMLRL